MNLHELFEELQTLKEWACGVMDRKQTVNVGETYILI
jgi:hypothetical protein